MRPSLHFAKRFLTKTWPREYPVPKLSSQGVPFAALGVEVGVDLGDNAKAMLDGWQEIHMTLVEVDAPKRVEIDYALRDFADRYDLVLADSAEAAASFPDEHFDFVYIDDDHSHPGVVKSLNAWWPKLRRGGVFCGHDWDMSPVAVEVTRFLAERGVPLIVDEIDWWGVKG